MSAPLSRWADRYVRPIAMRAPRPVGRALNFTKEVVIGLLVKVGL